MNVQKCLNTVCDIAEEMLKSGAEVHRVEETLVRMCKAIGALRADVFIITSSIVVTVYTENECSYTQTRRINSIGTDMEKLHRLNDLSRKVCAGELSLEKAKNSYKEIITAKRYPLWLEFLIYGLIGGSFALFFGGNLTEGFAAFVVGVVLRIVTYFSDKAKLGKIFCRFICSFTATLLAHLLVYFAFIPAVDNVIIGNIMVLIPGIGLTNAIRDLFVGDSIAGLLRFIEAVLIALAIAAGNFLFVILFKGGLL